MKKILILSASTQVSYTSSRILKQARTLIDAGCQVLVVSKCEEDQASTEIINGIQIKRIILLSKKIKSGIITHFLRFFEFYFKLKTFGFGFDVIDCHGIFSLLMGYRIAKKNNAKLLFNAHELETERTGLAGIYKKISKILEKKLIYKCSHIITVSKSIQDWYKKNYSIDNVSCIFNSPSYSDVFNKKNNYFKNCFNIPAESIIFLYQGMISDARGIDLILSCFKNLPINYVAVFMGYGNLVNDVKNLSATYNNIFYHEAVPMSKLKDITSSADYGMSLIEPVSLNEEYCMPNKLFEYIMYGVPVIGFNTKDQAEFIKKYDIGYVLENYDVVSLRELILSINPKKRCVFKENLQKIKKDISWETMAKQLLDIYLGV